ncbi:MAG: HU family DNA-binding protein [Phycisphaerales bacterium]|nr:MAG: HU family DNA-binding protein [Phycisphaerales bacterium]
MPQRESSGLRREVTTITKKDLIDRVAGQTGYRRADVKQVLQAVLDEVAAELGDGNRIEFRDFGIFEVRHRAARIAQNPRTLQPVQVPPKRSIRFKLGRQLREIMDRDPTPQIKPRPNPGAEIKAGGQNSKPGGR